MSEQLDPGRTESPAEVLARLRAAREAQQTEPADDTFLGPLQPIEDITVRPAADPTMPLDRVRHTVSRRPSTELIIVMALLAAVATITVICVVWRQQGRQSQRNDTPWQRQMLWENWATAQFNVIYWEMKHDAKRRQAWLAIANDWKKWDDHEAGIPTDISDALYVRRQNLLHGEPPVDLPVVKAARTEFNMRIYGTDDPQKLQNSDFPYWYGVISEYDADHPQWRKP